MKTAVVLVNGLPPQKKFLNEMVRKADFFICADGGANTAARYNIVPDYIIGDFDSVTLETLTKFASVPQKRIRSQNSTDLEKALTYAVRKNFSLVYVLGATGGRIDHELGNLSALLKFSKKISIIFVDRLGEIYSVGKHFSATVPQGTTLSLLPLTSCTGVSTHGLYWNLQNETLQMGVRDSISNVAVKENITIDVKKGDLLLFLLRGLR